MPDHATRDIFQPPPLFNKEPVYHHPLENAPRICTRLQQTLPSQLDLLRKLAGRPPALGPTNRYSLPKLNLVLCLFPRAGTVVRERDARERAGAKVLGAGCCLKVVRLCVFLKKTGLGEKNDNSPFSYCVWYQALSLRTFCCCCCCCCCCWPPNIWSKKPNWACAVSSQRLSAARERAKRGMVSQASDSDNPSKRNKSSKREWRAQEQRAMMLMWSFGLGRDANMPNSRAPVEVVIGAKPFGGPQKRCALRIPIKLSDRALIQPPIRPF
jgi:hypothetical protein